MSLGRFPDLAHTLPAFPPCGSDHSWQVDKRGFTVAGTVPDSHRIPSHRH